MHEQTINGPAGLFANILAGEAPDASNGCGAESDTKRARQIGRLADKECRAGNGIIRGLSTANHNRQVTPV